MSWGATTFGPPAEFLQSCLLLLLAEQDDHGYHLWHQIADFGLDMDSGTVYRHLRTMETDGLVASHWELSESGPPRRTYALTSSGRELLADCSRSMDDLAVLLDEFLRRSGDAMEALADNPTASDPAPIDEVPT